MIQSSATNGPRPRRARRTVPIAEPIEPRVLLSTYVVTNANDSGPGSLRDAVQQANANPGADAINFQVAPGATITLSSELDLTDSTGETSIEGPGAALLSISGNRHSRVFSIAASASANIDDLTMTLGRAPSGTKGITGTLNPDGTPVAGGPGAPGGDGGAIKNLGTLTLSGDWITKSSAGSAGNGGDGEPSSNGPAGSGGAGGRGGGIYSSGQLTVINSTVDSNIAGVGGLYGFGSGTRGDGAGGNGGGLFVAGPTVIINSTISSNQSGTAAGSLGEEGSGAGIASANQLTMVNCTVFANFVPRGFSTYNIPGNGGGIEAAGELRLTNVTAFSNSAAGGSGQGLHVTGHAILNNTIISRNPSSSPVLFSDVSGPLDPVSGFNLISADGTTSGLDPALGNQVGTLANPIDPKLAPLRYYLGPTLTMPPLPGSPAVDAGDPARALGPDGAPLTTDERGLLRISGASVDIGAVESQPVAIPLVVDTTADATTPAPGLSLRLATNLANISSGAQTITFDPRVFGHDAGPQRIVLGTALPISGQGVAVKGPGNDLLSVAGGIVVSAGANTSISGLTIGPVGHIDNSGALLIADCAFSGNVSPTGGAIYNEAGGSLHVSYCTFAGNYYTDSGGANPGNGGAIENLGNSYITASTFTANRALGGGAITSLGGALTVTDSTFSANIAGAAGGAIYNSGSNVLIAGCTFVGNSSSNPTLPTSGGAISNGGSPSVITIVNSTFYNNSAGDSGGAIVNSATLELVNCTLAGNRASRGFDLLTTTTVTVQNSIVGDVYSSSGSVGGSHNLIWTENGSVIGVDPKLGPLGNYGGPTQTIPLLPGSPALDAGSNALALDGSGHPLATDQRGLPRIFNGTVDIGAYEAQPPAVAGDLNHDGSVNFSDLLLLAQHYGSRTQPLWEGGDLTGDGSVAFADLLVLAQNYGNSSAPQVAAASLPVDPLPSDLPVSKARHRR